MFPPPPSSAIPEMLTTLEEVGSAVVSRIQQARKEDKEFDVKSRLVYGLVLCFLGGQFQTSLAFLEAFKDQEQRSNLFSSLSILKTQLSHAKHSYEEDDKKDENNDGIPDVHQTPNLLSRKALVMYRAVDPVVVRQAFQSLLLCLSFALARVQLRFAKVVQLGHVLGTFVYEHLVRKHVLSVLETQFPHDKEWIPFGTEYLCKLVATMIALKFSRSLTTVANAVLGGELILSAIQEMCMNRKQEFLTQGPVDEALALGVVSLGVLVQVSSGTVVRGLFNLVFFPLAISEAVLTMALAL